MECQIKKKKLRVFIRDLRVIKFDRLPLNEIGMPTKYDLEDRLILFSVSIIKLAEAFPKSFSGTHLAGQITRSATSPSLQYGEAQGAESRADFIHKIRIALKELRETNCCLKIISRLGWFEKNTLTEPLRECHELISIFMKSISTAKKNLR